MSLQQQIIQECWDNSLHALGTSYVFEQKAKFYKFWIRVITILGVVVPLLLGATVGVYGQKSFILTIFILVAGPLTIFQIILSGISLVFKWDDLLAYSLESQTDNRVLYKEYESLAKYPPSDIYEFEKQFLIIKTKDEARQKQDEKIPFSQEDNRKGMRYALWIRKKQCATCKKVPTSLTPSECETCGKY
jgi:mobilome CxxCx(11)CxxC protein